MAIYMVILVSLAGLASMPRRPSAEDVDLSLLMLDCLCLCLVPFLTRPDEVVKIFFFFDKSSLVQHTHTQIYSLSEMIPRFELTVYMLLYAHLHKNVQTCL